MVIIIMAIVMNVEKAMKLRNVEQVKTKKNKKLNKMNKVKKDSVTSSISFKREKNLQREKNLEKSNCKYLFKRYSVWSKDLFWLTYKIQRNGVTY